MPPPPPSVSKQQMWNAIRVAFVNANFPNSITYDPILTPAPTVSLLTILNGVLLAAQGTQQT